MLRRFSLLGTCAALVFFCAQVSQAGRLLQANSEGDDPAYRAAIAAFYGTVDYFDTRAGTPSLALLQTYDAVSTWTNSPHANNVALGNVLADYVDVGGRVILSVFSTYTNGYYLAGRIMTSGYSPVDSPSGGNHFSMLQLCGRRHAVLHRREQSGRDLSRLPGLAGFGGDRRDLSGRRDPGGVPARFPGVLHERERAQHVVIDRGLGAPGGEPGWLPAGRS